MYVVFSFFIISFRYVVNIQQYKLLEIKYFE